MIYKFSEFIKENIQDEYDFYEQMDEVIRDVFGSIKTKRKITLTKIPAAQYKKALEEFMKYGEFVRFPVKKIEQWKEIILKNTLLLNATTSIFGHTTYFPRDEFFDCFDYNNDTDEENDGEYSKWLKSMYKETKDKQYKDRNDYTNLSEFLEFCGIDEYIPTFSNDQYLISDYGLEPLIKECFIMIKLDNPEEIIVSINRALDISHQRSDLSELFIEGGYTTLNAISGIEKIYDK